MVKIKTIFKKYKLIQFTYDLMRQIDLLTSVISIRALHVRQGVLPCLIGIGPLFYQLFLGIANLHSFQSNLDLNRIEISWMSLDCTDYFLTELVQQISPSSKVEAGNSLDFFRSNSKCMGALQRNRWLSQVDRAQTQALKASLIT